MNTVSQVGKCNAHHSARDVADVRAIKDKTKKKKVFIHFWIKSNKKFGFYIGGEKHEGTIQQFG